MKQLMIALAFPAYHTRKGDPTYFPQKIAKSLGINLGELHDEHGALLFSKHHTIRAGKRWKTGDFVQLKMWSGRPYNSETIKLFHPLELTVFDIEIDRCLGVDINGKYFTTLCEGWKDAERLAKNDGLSVIDMQNWFQVNAKNFKGFSGQILVWGDVSYNQTPVLPPDTDIIDLHKIE